MSLLRQFLVLGCGLSVSAVIWLPASAQVATPDGQRGQAAAHAEQGFGFARAEQLDKAETELRQAAELAPSDPEVLAALGTILAQEHKLEESTQLFRRALRTNSANLTVRRYLAANLWQLHRYPEAKENLQINLLKSWNRLETEPVINSASLTNFCLTVSNRISNKTF